MGGAAVRTRPDTEGTASAPAPPPRTLRRADFLGPGESVLVRDAAVPRGVEAHVHDFYEIALVLSGSGSHVCGSRVEPLGAGDVLLVHPAVPHAYTAGAESPLHVRNVIFTEAALAGSLDSPEIAEIMGAFVRSGLGGGVPRLPAEGAEAGGDLALAAAMAAESLRREPGYQPALRGHLAALLVRLWRRYRRAGRPGPDPGAWSRLLPALRHLHEHAGAGLHAGDLAAAAGWSPDHFGRLFREATGETARAFLRRLRTDRAAALLLATDRPVEAVALEAGYSGARALRRAFAACFGTTPEAYRRGGPLVPVTPGPSPPGAPPGRGPRP